MSDTYSCIRLDLTLLEYAIYLGGLALARAEPRGVRSMARGTWCFWLIDYDLENKINFHFSKLQSIILTEGSESDILPSF